MIGLITPFIAYALLLMMYEQLDAWDITGGGMGDMHRERTVGLLAIAANMLPINIFKRKYQIHNMRGIVLATLFYVVVWVVLYWKYIL